MSTIYKYTITIADKFTLKLPRDAIVLSLQLRYDSPVMWCKINKGSRLVDTNFRWYSTGESIEENLYLSYKGTLQLSSGHVYHLFQEHEEVDIPF